MLRLRLAEARGSALVPALLIMSILLAFGAASLALVEGDQSDSRRERERESSFQLAEGVLNAEIYRLSTRWPAATSLPYPTACTAVSPEVDCPGGATLQANFSGPDYNRPTTWKVQVRDNADGTQKNFYSEALIATNPPKDANGDKFVWVRAEAQVAGSERVLVALVEAENVTLNFPTAALVAGKFEVSNTGNKVLIDTNGDDNEFAPGDIIVRCNKDAAGCAEWDKGKGQVSPDTVKTVADQPSAVTPEQLEQLRAQAQSQGNLYPQGGTNCPASLQGDVAGEVVFIEDADSCSPYNGGTINTQTKPGFLVIAKGSIKLSSGQLVRSKDKFPKAKGFQTQAYFVSAEVKAKGIKKGAIGTWAASAPTGGKVIAVGGVANNATKLQAGVGPKRLGFGEKTDGFSESRTCVQHVAAG